jgi:hypothetical protein
LNWSARATTRSGSIRGEERFRDLFEEAPIAYVHEGWFALHHVNRAAMRILGIKPEEVEHGKSFVPAMQRLTIVRGRATFVNTKHHRACGHSLAGQNARIGRGAAPANLEHLAGVRLQPAGRRRDSAVFGFEDGVLAKAGTPNPALDEVERRHIETILNQTHWMIEGERGAAKVLNLNPSTLRSRMQKLGIKRPSR